MKRIPIRAQTQHLASLLAPCVAILLLMLALPAAVRAADPLTCVGYAEPRVFLDSQGWWIRGAGPGFGHVHAAACFPLQQRIKGTFPLDVRITMHNNPGRVTSLTMQIGADGQYVAAKKGLNLTCPATCDFWVHLDVNTSGFSNDGWQEFRLRPKVSEPDGKELVSTTGWQIYLTNGKSISNYRNFDWTEARGWYTGAGYARARIRTGYRPGVIHSGVISLDMQCDADVTVTGCLITWNPNFHANYDGIVIKRTTGAFRGKVAIDTRLVPNGCHKLVVRTEARPASSITQSGILGVPICVRN